MLNLLINKVFAAGPGGEAQTVFGNFKELGEYVDKIYAWVLPIASVAAVILIIVSGYQILTSQGNDSQIAEAKKGIGVTLAGLVMLYLIHLLIDILIVNYTL